MEAKVLWIAGSRQKKEVTASFVNSVASPGISLREGTVSYIERFYSFSYHFVFLRERKEGIEIGRNKERKKFKREK